MTTPFTFICEKITVFLSWHLLGVRHTGCGVGGVCVVCVVCVMCVCVLDFRRFRVVAVGACPSVRVRGWLQDSLLAVLAHFPEPAWGGFSLQSLLGGPRLWIGLTPGGF